ncbi:phosphohydrolase [Bacillus sp. UMB0899]|uniref:HD-GYP domain-containing protein n=1 Tax=Metabacillus schmidteae TaxID=2730405 RepID=UPI000C801D03|nr:HD-GYP domain-containing protein [Metabacillus schmidteae]PMC34495.1 phosphohydrolase [Bacillus sp. UMB0899]
MAGFQVRKKGSSLEKVKLNSDVEFSLLTRGDGAEVLHQTIEEGRLFYVYPSDNPNSLEFYFILSGHVSFEFENERHILGPEDYFIARDLKDPIHFTTLSKLSLLCVFTEQVFKHISKDISALIEIVNKVEEKDRYTYKHSERVAQYSVKIARKLKLNKENLENLTISASLHDIGKIHVPIEVLNKPSRLTDEEFALIKKHPVDGAKMLNGTSYEELAPIIEQHHERLNGTGYPYGLKGNEILLEARIIAVSDTFDAMTEDRAYRKAMNDQIAIDELIRLSGTHYDEDVVKAFEEILKEEGRIK